MRKFEKFKIYNTVEIELGGHAVITPKNAFIEHKKRTEKCIVHANRGNKK